MKRFKKTIKIVEVGPRDGLQNEKKLVSTENKIKLIQLLSQTGIQTIETTSFVSPKWIPQLKDAELLYSKITKKKGVNYPVLIPNLHGLERAISCGVKDISIFISASESFSKKDMNCDIKAALNIIKKISTVASRNQIKMRGYISCVMGCPYEGQIAPSKVKKLAKKLLDFGCYEISLSDTIGIGNINLTKKLLDNIVPYIPKQSIALHLHNTRGQALVNIFNSLEYGVTTFDSSIGGLGGCPFAKGAAGNVATEDLVYMFKGMGYNTGIDLEEIYKVREFVRNIL